MAVENFQQITGIYVRFDPHPIVERAQAIFNSYFAAELPHLDALFTDDTMSTLRENVVPLIRSQIATELVTPIATHTEDPICIGHIVDACPLKVSWSRNGSATRLSRANLIAALTQAIENAGGKSSITVDIHVAIGCIFFPDDPHLSFLDWSVFSLTPIAPEERRQPLTVDSLVEALTAVRNRGTTERRDGDADRATDTSTTAYTFNPATLPRDVRRAWERFQENAPVRRSEVEGEFDSGNRYYIDGSERLFLRDGSLFLMSTELDVKGLLRDPVTCKDDSHQGLRSWYQTFMRHCMDNGFYVHPFYCFRKDHGGAWGFTAGNDDDDDLPLRMQIPLQKMSQPIFRLLMQKNMFPSDSACTAIIQQCYGDGYKAIKQLVFASHPVFQDQPSTLIMSYPRQRNSSLIKYYNMFLDYMKLRAFISDHPGTLDDDAELDAFIHNAKYADFLNRVTRDERKVAALEHKYTSEQIVETLETFLQAPDSPLIAAQRAEAQQAARASTTGRAPDTRQPSNRSSTNRRPSRRGVNALGVQDEDVPDLAATSTDDSLDQFASELLTMEVPDDPEARKVHTLYAASLYRIDASKPNQKCIVCGGQHVFDGCEILKNTDFLRGHYIRYCQQIRRDAASRAQAFPGTAGAIPGAPINAIGGDFHPESPDSDTDDEQDFQTARR